MPADIMRLKGSFGFSKHKPVRMWWKRREINFFVTFPLVKGTSFVQGTHLCGFALFSGDFWLVNSGFVKLTAQSCWICFAGMQLELYFLRCLVTILVSVYPCWGVWSYLTNAVCTCLSCACHVFGTMSLGASNHFASVMRFRYILFCSIAV